MENIIEILAVMVLLLFCLAGFVALFFTTFGTLIILIGTIIYSILVGFSVIGLKSFVILLILYFFGETMEYLLVIIGAKKLGASNLAVVGAMAGAFIGAIAGASFLGVGIILGTFLGIFLGAFLVEFLIHKDFLKSLKAGTGGVLGRVGSILVKVVVAISMFVVIALRILAARSV